MNMVLPVLSVEHHAVSCQQFPCNRQEEKAAMPDPLVAHMGIPQTSPCAQFFSCMRTSHGFKAKPQTLLLKTAMASQDHWWTM
jgi:hypothetical protein